MFSFSCDFSAIGCSFSFLLSDPAFCRKVGRTSLSASLKKYSDRVASSAGGLLGRLRLSSFFLFLKLGLACGSTAQRGQPWLPLQWLRALRVTHIISTHILYKRALENVPLFGYRLLNVMCFESFPTVRVQMLRSNCLLLLIACFAWSFPLIIHAKLGYKSETLSGKWPFIFFCSLV